MKIIQTEIRLSPKKRGFHLITEEILQKVPEISNIQTGIFCGFIKHTSASLSINENADPTVRVDLDNHLNKMVLENMPYYIHTYEGADDMPAHIKTSLLGCSVQIPISKGKLNLGLWQGIYLGEHRDHGGPRTLVITLMGNEI